MNLTRAELRIDSNIYYGGRKGEREGLEGKKEGGTQWFILAKGE